MKKFKMLSCIAVLCVFAFGYSWAIITFEAAGIIAFEAAEIKETGSNKTALKLYKKINEKKGTENIFFSPYSIRTCFGMLYEGAQGNTAKELENIFSFERDEKKRLFSVQNELKNYNSMNDGYGIQVANSFWANQDRVIKPAYKSILKDYYFAQLETMNVKNSQESASRINAWVNDKTKGRIPSIIDSSDIVYNPPIEETLAVLVNAIYFKAKWFRPFESENTKKRDFYISKNGKIEVDMMYIKDERHFGYLENDKVQVLKMRYQNVENMPSMSMIVVLPKEDNIYDAENYIYSNTIADIQKSFNNPEVIVYFPKFELSWKMEMLKTIENMGLNNTNPDYSKICDWELEISKVIHKAFIKIDEKETEAAAATAVVMGFKSASLKPPKPQPKIFKADHSFMYLIVDENANQILFIGKMLNPDDKAKIQYISNEEREKIDEGKRKAYEKRNKIDEEKRKAYEKRKKIDEEKRNKIYNEQEVVVCSHCGYINTIASGKKLRLCVNCNKPIK